jgi:hypothetical protein
MTFPLMRRIVEARALHPQCLGPTAGLPRAAKPERRRPHRHGQPLEGIAGPPAQVTSPPMKFDNSSQERPFQATPGPPRLPTPQPTSLDCAAFVSLIHELREKRCFKSRERRCRFTVNRGHSVVAHTVFCRGVVNGTNCRLHREGMSPAFRRELMPWGTLRELLH